MVGFLMVIHYITCFAMVLVILLQSGKGGGLAGAFGGGGSTIFGGRGAGTVLTRATMFLGALFFITSLSLALLSTQGGGVGSSKSLIQEEAKRSSASEPPTGPAQGTAPAAGPQRQTLPSGTPAPTQQAPPTKAPETKPNPAPAPAGSR